MAILIREKGHETLFTLQTDHSTYQIKADRFGMLLHTYYGASVPEEDLSYTIRRYDRGFSGNPAEAGGDRTYSNDTLPLEYSAFGTGDYRISPMESVYADGSNAADLRYVSYRTYKGKYSIPGLPCVHASEDEADTLEITLRDTASDLVVILLYGVIPAKDAITRAVRYENTGDRRIMLLRALSLCLDFQRSDLDLLHFHGRHTMERMMERVPLCHGIVGIESTRGNSSHQHNPFVILADRQATEDFGDCYGFSFVYSGNFMAQAEVTQLDDVRFLMGIHTAHFAWRLEGGASFSAPEVIMTYSEQGFAKLSHRLHRLIRQNLMRGPYRNASRPILINNWEATYFQFNTDKLLEIARGASKLGIDMFVLDDGWFGKRNDDNSGLGDWYVNEEKVIGGLGELVSRINAMGMKFGLWFEPEMISEDSDLYRAHPDYALQMPGRAPTRSRNQLVLDMSRKDVRDAVYAQMRKVLDSANIEYIKWDMNRSLSNVWSATLPEHRQGELYHRYVLGVYDLKERLLTDYPKLLLEGCCGGGGRFDAGMLYYAPQIWCSDDTDAIERQKIQYGTSFGYPVSSMGSHVSASPNHQTGRVTSLKTRGITAMAGTFGYELNVYTMTDDEKETVKEQIREFRKYEMLIQNGLYYRLTNPMENNRFNAWQFVAEDGSESLLCLVKLHKESNEPLIRVKAKGLLADGIYEIEGTQEAYSGAALMNAGYSVMNELGEYDSMTMHLVLRK